MTDPQPYLWTYDRSRWDDRPGTTTFSVGLYQRVPKAAGGLKRSVTIRVNGYVADAAAVYARADELVERRNRERVRLDHRPPWLRQSYAVAKPAGFEERRRSADLTAAEARAVRNRVVGPLVRAAGYVQTHASTFACRRGEVVRLMHFQTSSSVPSFTVNLGLHPTFVPIGREEPERIRWTDIEQHQCALRGRIGFGLPEKLDTWWPFGSDAEALAQTYARVAGKACDILDRQADAFERWCEQPAGNLNCPDQWGLSYPATVRACVEMRVAQLDASESRLAAAMREGLEANRAWFGGMLRAVDRLRAADGDAAHTAELLGWLLD